MKKCRSCGELKKAAEFYRCSGRRDNRQVDCKVCQNEYLKKHRRYIRSVVNRWKEIKGCSVCSFKGKHYQLDLDHRDPGTKNNKGNSRAYEPSWRMQRVKEELSKCDILCKNCHAEKTFKNKDHLPK